MEKNSKKLETNWLKISFKPRTRKCRRLRIIRSIWQCSYFFDRQILLISNKDNQYIYGEKYDFEFR